MSPRALIVEHATRIAGLRAGTIDFIGHPGSTQISDINQSLSLQDAQNVQAIAHHGWLLIPCLFVIVTVLMFNFLGDGLRDAADPYSR